MKIALTAAVAAIALASASYYFTQSPTTEVSQSSTPAQGDPMVSVRLPDDLSPQAGMGKRAFDATCAACHGENASGRLGFGPPLVHKIYEPGHHGDEAFQIAAQNGVRAHHWKFGDMPAQTGLTRADVAAIVTYIRKLQRANGID